MSDERHREFAGFERRAREAFDASVDAMDDATRSRLAQARQRALAATNARPAPSRLRRWSTWAPAGALAASVLVAALLLRGPVEVTPGADPMAANPAPLGQESIELLAAGDEFEIATADEDLEFYEWVDQATADNVGGNGQS